jgi:hypothetical protein
MGAQFNKVWTQPQVGLVADLRAAADEEGIAAGP